MAIDPSKIDEAVLAARRSVGQFETVGDGRVLLQKALGHDPGNSVDT